MLHVVDDIYLVKEDERAQGVEGRVIEHTSEDDILEVLQSVCLVDLFLDRLITELDDAFEARSAGEECSVVCLVCRELGIVCVSRLVECQQTIKLADLHSRMPTTPMNTSSCRIKSYIPWSFMETKQGSEAHPHTR